MVRESGRWWLIVVIKMSSANLCKEPRKVYRNSPFCFEMMCLQNWPVVHPTDDIWVKWSICVNALIWEIRRTQRKICPSPTFPSLFPPQILYGVIWKWTWDSLLWHGRNNLCKNVMEEVMTTLLCRLEYWTLSDEHRRSTKPTEMRSSEMHSEGMEELAKNWKWHISS